MRRIFNLCAAFVLTAIAAGVASSDTAEADYLPRCGGMFDLCGYVDRKTGEALIPARFERAFGFSQGLAAVRIEGEFGYIDLSGEVVIDPQFDLAGAFHEGLAEVLVGDVTGVIDQTGEFVVQPRFARAIPFTADTVVVANGTWRNTYFSGRDRLDGLTDMIAGIGNSRVGLYHVKDGWITEPVYSVKTFGAPARGLIWATTQNRHGGPFGLLRADGTWQVEPRFSHVQSLHEGRAVVRGKPDARPVNRGSGRRDPSGAVDRDGTLVVPLVYNFLSYWHAGYGVARKDGRHGFVSPDGTLLAGRYFDKVERPDIGQLPRVRDGQNWYSVAPDGTLIADEKNNSIIAQCPGGLLIREINGLAEFSHPDHAKPIGPLFDREYRYRNVDCAVPVPVSRNGKWGFVTQTGKLFPDPISFDNVTLFQNGFAAVQQGGAWGILDESGAFSVEPAYENLSAVRGIFRVLHEGREFWIDAQGAEAPEPESQPADHAAYLACRAGSRLYSENGKWGMAGPAGEVIIEPVYRALSCFSQGVAWAAAEGGTAWCPVGPGGQPRRKPRCRALYYPYIQTHHYPEEFSDNPYESSVLWVRAYLDFGLGRRATPPVWVSDGVRGNISSSVIPQ